MKPLFYSRQLQDYVIDEMCRCGHLKSTHGSLLHRIKKSMLRESNEGSCCSNHCECLQFTFVRFVTVEEIVQSKRQSAMA